MINALTIDVEDYYHVEAFTKVIDRSTWDTYPSRVAENTRRILDLLDRKNVRATFFVLGWVAERQPAIVAEIAAAAMKLPVTAMDTNSSTGRRPRSFRPTSAVRWRSLELPARRRRSWDIVRPRSPSRAARSGPWKSSATWRSSTTPASFRSPVTTYGMPECSAARKPDNRPPA